MDLQHCSNVSALLNCIMYTIIIDNYIQSDTNKLFPFQDSTIV